MTYRHKLARRLALIRDHAVLATAVLAAACSTDGGLTGSGFDPLDSNTQIVRLIASSDNPTIPAASRTPLRAVGLTADGRRSPVKDAVWVTLDGGTIVDTLVEGKAITYFSANEPGDYRLVTFDRGKRLRDTTRVTVPQSNQVIAKLYIVPAVAALVAGGTQQFYVYGRTDTGDSVAVVASLEPDGGSASGLLYTAGDTSGTYQVTARRQGGPESAAASVTIAAGGTKAPASEPAPTSPTTSEPTSPYEPAPAPPVSSGPAELPRVWVDTRMPSQTGRTIVVPAGGDLQAAINTAQRGDVIELAAGATYTDNFELPAKSGTGWVVIRSAGTLPQEGTRVTPATAAGFAKLRSSNSMSTIKASAPGSGYYRLVGLDIGSSADMTYSLVYLGNTAATSVSQLPTHIVLDRVWVHGTSTQAIQRCVALNSAHSAVIDSYLSDCHMKGFDSQAIIGWAGPGPYKIVNNYLAGAGENIMFGGADPKISGLVPSDIEIRGNHITKPLAWKTSNLWSVKNLYESKNSQRVLLEDNILENNWANAQTGIAILLKSENQSGACTWCTTADYTFRYNKLINSPGGFMITGSQVTTNGGPSIPAARITIAHTLFDAVAVTGQTGATRLFQVGPKLRDLVLQNNSGFPEGYLFFMTGAEGSETQFVMQNNLFAKGQIGIFGNGTTEGLSSLRTYAPNAVVSNNVLVGADPAKYPSENAFPTSLLSAGLLGTGIDSYQLGSTSYSATTTDGQPAGVNFAELERRLTGVK